MDMRIQFELLVIINIICSHMPIVIEMDNGLHFAFDWENDFF
jgi:hypothetical protein